MVSGTPCVVGGSAPHRLSHDVVATVSETSRFPTLTRRRFLVLGGGAVVLGACGGSADRTLIGSDDPRSRAASSNGNGPALPRLERS